MTALIETPLLIARALQHAPDYTFKSKHSRLFGARWQHPACDLSTRHMAEHVLVHHLSGSTRIERRSGGRVTGTHSKIGSSTFVSCHHETEWHIGSQAQVMHLYLPQAVLEDFVTEEIELDETPEIREFFAAEDPWLAGLFSMLRDELESHGPLAVGGETFLLDQLQHAVVRHLVLRHSSIDSNRLNMFESAQAGARMSPNRLAQVVAFIEASYAQPIQLQDLTTIACMSKDHFVKAFRNTVGQTPYRYLLALRLAHAGQMLRSRRELSIAEIASLNGFRNASHFSTAFSKTYRVAPKIYRDSA